MTPAQKRRARRERAQQLGSGPGVSLFTRGMVVSDLKLRGILVNASSIQTTDIRKPSAVPHEFAPPIPHVEPRFVRGPESIAEAVATYAL